MGEQIHLGKWTEERLTDLITEASLIHAPGDRIAFLSKDFLNTKYRDSTLTGERNVPEVFVINLEFFDCFTFIEYVDAMRMSNSFSGFREHLRNVRYHSGHISYKNRNHFFTDWKAFNADFIVDMTNYIGADRTKDVSKRLNEKDDGTLFLPGVACRLREVTYIPSLYVNNEVIENLNTGDYAGIYSKKEGLDVSHVGIIIKEQDAVTFRHASSLRKHRKVIDEDFRDYLRAKPGIIILRARE